MLENITLSRKLMGSFLVVAFITLGIGVVGFWGVSVLGKHLTEVGSVRLPSIESLRAMESETRQIVIGNRTLLNPTLSDEQFKRQLAIVVQARENYQKALKIYESLPQTPEEAEEWKRYVQAYAEWTKEVDEYLRQANAFFALGIRNPTQLERDLARFQGDHYKLLLSVIDLIEGREELTGGDDHTACNFGRWVASFKTESSEINRLVAETREPHQKFHAYIKQARQLTARGDRETATRLFHGVMEEVVAATFQKFDELQKVTAQAQGLFQQMTDQVMGPVVQRLQVAASSLEEIVHINEGVAKATLTQSHSDERMVDIIMIVGMIAGFLLALLFGWFIGNNISGIITVFRGEMEKLIEAAVAGKLSARARLELINFEFRPLAEGVNRTLDAVIGPLNVAAEYVDRISKGDIPRPITDTYHGDFNELKVNINQLIDAMETINRVTGEMAQGNLDQTVRERSAQDELMRSLKQMTESLNTTLGEIRIATDQVAQGASQISDASQSLSQGATESAASLEEISSSITEISSQTETNAENAGQANQLATQTRSSAETGNQRMGEMMKAMSDIQESSKQIAKIIKVIDDIAFQTNLLALNAAVEAARAGRHGKGFAVVADEVRNLAGRSAKAAKETAEMIESSMKKVEVGTTIALNTESALKEIVASSIKVADLVGEIAAASNEQAQGISQVGQGIAQIDKVTQQNTANAEETAAAAEELSSQSAEVKRLVAQFKVRNAHGQGGSRGKGTSGSRRRQVEPADDDDGGADDYPPPSAGRGRGVKPSEVIALDDKEFGKF